MVAQRHLRTDFASLYPLLGEDKMLHDAFDLADRAHEGQSRSLATGRVPYIVHPLFVFFQLRAWGVTDRACLAAALLHDTVEDAPERVWQYAASPSRNGTDPESARERALFAIGQHFGMEVARTVDGLSNRPGTPYVQHVSEETKEPRVLVVKCADATHNALMLDPRHPRAAKLVAKYAPMLPVLAKRLTSSKEAQQLLPAWEQVAASFS